MAHVITSPCMEEKASICSEVCPVDAIQEGDKQFYIDPNTCIDCGACIIQCPVSAIFYEEEVPEDEIGYIQKNAEFFSRV
ncbi:indolepyruvate ferredoxin oxidoreductase subunit alpha [Siminovitchia sediminis]|uniref:Ferredoxin n=1 Tax=Siminovitchia sediminis TaxID=1274353 RepID=A0ABW4KK67_9BACI